MHSYLQKFVLNLEFLVTFWSLLVTVLNLCVVNTPQPSTPSNAEPVGCPVASLVRCCSLGVRYFTPKMMGLGKWYLLCFKYGHFWVAVRNFWGVYFPPPKKLPRESALALQTGNNTWRLLVFSVGFCEDFW